MESHGDNLLKGEIFLIQMEIEQLFVLNKKRGRLITYPLWISHVILTFKVKRVTINIY